MSTFVISNKTTQILCKFTGGPKAHDWEISSAHSQFFLERTLDHRVLVGNELEKSKKGSLALASERRAA
jgi:hypothetical protein